MNRNVVARAVQGDSELQLWENYLTRERGAVFFVFW